MPGANGQTITATLDVQATQTPASMELRGLWSAPEETWDTMRRFINLNDDDIAAMVATSEILLRNAADFVVAAYDHLRNLPETASILGWEQEVDEEHLAERRRFFAVWIARTIGIDLSHEFARYMYRAGRIHAGHGPRQISVDDMYVTGTMTLILDAFGSWFRAAGMDTATATRALTGWNKYLLMQLQVMLDGTRAARAIEEGNIAVRVALFGRMRALLGREEMAIRVASGDSVGTVLVKFFNYYPEVRSEALDWEWVGKSEDATWLTDFEKVYTPKRYWNVLLNGKDVRFLEGFNTPVQDGDVVGLFPPGR